MRKKRGEATFVYLCACWNQLRTRIIAKREVIAMAEVSWFFVYKNDDCRLAPYVYPAVMSALFMAAFCRQNMRL